MHRFFVDSLRGDSARITGEDVRHIVRVLRLHVGDAVTLCDGEGTDCDAVITALSDDAVDCRTGECRASLAEPACRITVLQCLPKTGKMESIVQKCTELGASEFVPVISRRCVVQPTNNFEIKRVRYQRVALEAAKQSRRARIPRFGALERLEALDPARYDLFLLAYEEEHTRSLKSVLQQSRHAASIGVLIGPEGGFSEEEAMLLAERGAIPVSLGARILRTETAGMAMVAQVLYEVDP